MNKIVAIYEQKDRETERQKRQKDRRTEISE